VTVLGGAAPQRGRARPGARDELLGVRATHQVVLGVGNRELDAQRVENPNIRRPNLLVVLVQRFEAGVEAVGVLHRELLCPEESATGVVVAVFRANLVVQRGQVLVGANRALDEMDDALLVGGSETHLLAVAVFEGEHLALEVLPAAALLPDGAVVQLREVHPAGANGSHLAFDVVEHLLAHALARGREAVEAAAELPDEAGPEDELDGLVLVAARLAAREQRGLGSSHAEVTSNGRSPAARY